MNLRVSRNSTKFLEGRVGLNLNYKIITANKSVITPQLKVSYGYDFIGKKTNAINSTFVGQTASFTTKTAAYDPSSFRVGGSINFISLNSFDLSAEYHLEIKSKYRSNFGLIKLGYKF